MDGYTKCPECNRDLVFCYEYDGGIRYLSDGSGIPPEEHFDYECETGCELDLAQIEDLMTKAREAWDQR